MDPDQLAVERERVAGVIGNLERAGEVQVLRADEHTPRPE